MMAGGDIVLKRRRAVGWKLFCRDRAMGFVRLQKGVKEKEKEYECREWYRRSESMSCRSKAVIIYIESCLGYHAGRT